MYRHIVSFICLLTCAIVSANDAQVVTLHLDWGPMRWQGYPKTLNNPIVHWEGNVMVVSVVENWESSYRIDEKMPRAILDGNLLTLCYKKTLINNTSQQPVPGFSAPVLMKFTVAGLSVRNYSISVSGAC